MADIKVSNGERAVAAIYEDDGDEGLLFWVCECGQQSERTGNMGDVINDAEVHVDHQCRYRD